MNSEMEVDSSSESDVISDCSYENLRITQDITNAVEAERNNSYSQSRSDPGSDFWNAPTPPLHLIPTNRNNGMTLEKIRERYSLNRRFHRTQPQICKIKSLSIMSTTLQTLVGSPHSWINEKRFTSSKNVQYILRIPRDVLAFEVIHQTVELEVHRTLRNFCIKQKLIHRSRIFDRWIFEYGLVRPKANIVWRVIMARSYKSAYFSGPTMTDHATIVTEFYDGNQLLHKYQACVVFK